MLVTATHQVGQDVSVSFDKEALKLISKVANHAFFSSEANWRMVSIVFKHNSSNKRLTSGFKNNFTKTDNVKVKANMTSGEVYELHEIIISGPNRQPKLSIKRSEIENASSMDLTLGSGGGVTPDPVTLALSTASNSVLQAFNVTAAFSESVTGFALSDISVTNGTASNLTGSGANYSFTVTPASDGQISVSVPQGSATASSNVSNNASNSLSVTYYAPVSVTLSTASNSVSQAFSVTATFSKSVTGFALGDISVTNGTASNLSGSGSSYTFDVTPSANGNVAVSVLSGSILGAGGETNTASNSLSVTYAELPGYRYYKFAAQKGWSSTTDLTTESNNISISEIAFKWDGEIQDMSSYGATVTNIKNPSYGANSNIFDNSLVTYRNWVVGGNSYEDLFKIDLNVKKDVELITISAYNNASSIGNIPKAFKIYGSNNDNTWTEILSVNEADTSTWAKFVPYGRRPFNIGSYSSNLFTALTNSNWNSASNWLNNSVPNGSDTFAEFYRGHTHVVNLDADVSLDKLAFYYSGQTISSTSAKTLQIAGTNKQIKSKVSSLAGMPIISTAINLTNGANILGSDGYLRLSGTVNASGGTINNYSNHLDLTGASNNFASAIVNNYKNLYASSGSLAGGATINLDATNNDVEFGATMASGTINFNCPENKTITITGYPRQTNLSAGIPLNGTINGTLKVFGSSSGYTVTLGNVSASNLVFGNNAKILVDSTSGLIETQLPLNINGNVKIQIGAEDSTVSGAIPFARFNSGYTTISNSIDMVGSPDYVNGAAIRTYGTNATLNGNIVLDAKGTSKANTRFLLSDYGTGDMIVTGNISNGSAANASNCWLSIENTVRLEGTNSFTSPIEIGYGFAGAQAANLVVKSPINSNLVYMRNGTIQIETGVSSTAFDIDTISTSPKIFYSSVPNTGNLNIGSGATNFRLYPWIQSQSSAARAESVFTLNGNITATAGGAAWSIYPTAASGNKMSKVVVNGNITSSNAITANLQGITAVAGTYTLLEYTGTWTGTPTFATAGTGWTTGTTITHDVANKKIVITKV